MDIYERYKEIISVADYGTVRYQNMRGLIRDERIVFIDIDEEVIGVIDPSVEALYGVYNDAYADVMAEAVQDIVNDPEAYIA